MSYETQRLANRFPGWTKLRREPGSFGQRMLSPLGELLGQARADKQKWRSLLDPHVQDLGLGRIQIVDLEGDDQIQFRLQGSDKIPLTLTEVAGFEGEERYVLAEVSSFEEFRHGAPSRVSPLVEVPVTAYALYDSDAPAFPPQIQRPERLCVRVDGSARYLSRRPDERPFSGHRGVLLIGLDPSWLPISEFVSVPDDGIYWTHNSFQVLYSVVGDGFDGRVRVQVGGFSSTEIRDPFRVGASAELEGPLHYRIYEVDGHYFLRCTVPHYLSGTQYRAGDVDLADETHEDVLAEPLLLDAEGAEYTPLDCVVHPEDARLYVLGEDARLHVYELGPIPFAPPRLESSEEPHVCLVALSHRPRLGETLSLWTWFRTLRAPVVSVRVFRYSPAGALSYLQANFSWDSAPYSFPGDPLAGLPEDTWQDLQFDLTLTETGQWEIYTETRLRGSTEVYRGGLLLQCEAWTAECSLETDVEGPQGLFVTRDGLLAVKRDSGYVPMRLKRDVYLSDPRGQRLMVHEGYDGVEVTP